MNVSKQIDEILDSLLSFLDSKQLSDLAFSRFVYRARLKHNENAAEYLIDEYNKQYGMKLPPNILQLGQPENLKRSITIFYA